MLNVNGTWIISNLKDHLLQASQKLTTKRYYDRRFDRQAGTFDLVYWTLVKRVRSRMRLAKFCQTSKIMYGWLPTNYIQSPVTGVSRCPGCRYQKETLNHVLRCSNKEAREAREARKTTLGAFRKEGKKKIPQKVIDRIQHLLTHYM